MTTDPAIRPVYHPAIDRILANHLGGTDAVAELHRTAQTNRPDPLATLLHQAALRAGEHHIRLERRIRHAHNDLHASAEELADGRPTEHLLTGRQEELLVFAHRHHDAVTALRNTATAYAAASRLQTSDASEGA